MNIYCGRCGRDRKHYCKGMCRDCYQTVTRKRRAKGTPPPPPEPEPTLEELDRLIAERLPTMPKDSLPVREITDGSDVRRRVAGVCRVLLVPGRVKR